MVDRTGKWTRSTWCFLDCVSNTILFYLAMCLFSFRFATIVVYLSDVEEGGETAFPEGKALDGSDKSYTEVLDELNEKGYDLKSIGIKPGSWEERLVVQCRSKLAVKPRKAEAVLFYDQHPDGAQDMAALHGGCPVISGTKWAANLWVWNGKCCCCCCSTCN